VPRLPVLLLGALLLSSAIAPAEAARRACPWPRAPRYGLVGCTRLVVGQPYRVAGPIRIHDGDTFSFGVETVRLRAIDTPEFRRPGSRAAARRLAALLRSGAVTIVPHAEDVYGRVVADVYVDGHDVARVLRLEGFDTRSRPHE
jgi:endonuclease YncB( thermonuclease family)